MNLSPVFSSVHRNLCFFWAIWTVPLNSWLGDTVPVPALHRNAVGMPKIRVFFNPVSEDCAKDEDPPLVRTEDFGLKEKNTILNTSR